MTPSLRTLPIVDARWDAMSRTFVVTLPGNIALPAPTEYDVTELVRRHAPGSAVRWVYPQSTTAGIQASRTP